LESDKRLDGAGLYSLFDMIAGTSAGVIPALGVAYDKVPYINSNYEKMSKSIFQWRWWSCWGVFGSRYLSAGRNAAFKQFIDENGGEEALKTSVVIPFILANSRTSHVYKNYDDNKFSLLDSVLSSTAAPTYFEPHIFPNKAGIKCEGVDGGLFANHPGQLLYQEAKIKYPDANRYVMLSLGTGKAYKDSEGSSFLGKSIFSWSKELSSIVIDSATSCIDELFARKSSRSNSTFHYIRINPTVDKRDIKTDDISNDYMERLRRITNIAISTPGESAYKGYEEIIERLVYHKHAKSEFLKIEEEKNEEKDND
jgi:patatin-like phospholipase/acyl hydrolase